MMIDIHQYHVQLAVLPDTFPTRNQNISEFTDVQCSISSQELQVVFCLNQSLSFLSSWKHLEGQEF